MSKEGYKELEGYCGMTIDQAVMELIDHRKAGEKVYTVFNGVTLYSDTVTMDGAYKEITGMTRSEFLAARQAEREEWERKEEEHKKKIPQLTREWIEKGHKILDKKYWELWDECVPIRLSDLYHGMELGCTLDIVEKLNAGCDFAEAKEILDGQGHSGMSFSLMCSMLNSFCDRGAEFVEYAR